MMTNAPTAGSGEILDVKLPRPRECFVLVENAQYSNLCSGVLHFLHERHAKKYA